MNETQMMDVSTTNAVEHYMMKAETLQVRGAVEIKNSHATNALNAGSWC